MMMWRSERPDLRSSTVDRREPVSRTYRRVGARLSRPLRVVGRMAFPVTAPAGRRPGRMFIHRRAAMNVRICRIRRASGQAGSDHRRPGRSPHHRRVPGSGGDLQASHARRVGGRHRAKSTDRIMLSDGKRSGRTLAEPPICVAPTIDGHSHVGVPDRALCAPARSTFLFGGCIDGGRADDECR
jgi:hypothetical protein